MAERNDRDNDEPRQPEQSAPDSGGDKGLRVAPALLLMGLSRVFRKLINTVGGGGKGGDDTDW